MSWLLAQADARRIPLPDGSVSCCVTSPPYFGLRSYLPDAHALKAREMGLEDSPAAYVAAMVRAFREVKRVLHPSGTLWLNCGDSYSSGMRQGQVEPGGDVGHPGMRNGKPTRPPVVDGLKSKDMIGIPWMLAFALRDDGWWLRSEIIWSKPNPMPEPVTDRPTKSHEQVFLLSKRETYFYDAEAVREEGAGRERFGNVGPKQSLNGDRNDGDRRDMTPTANRNLRSVWSIPTESWPGAHYATFPRRLVEPCVKAGSSQRGVCPECGSPWERVVERTPDNSGYPNGPGGTKRYQSLVRGSSGTLATVARYQSSTLGWRPTCRHAHEPIPATILDPFCGSATTGVVATALGRRFVGLDLSRDYLVNQARRRLERPHAPAIRPERAEPMPLFDGGEPC